MKDEIKSIPTEDEELDTEETSVSENGNSQKIWVYGVGLLGVVLERKSLNVNEVYDEFFDEYKGQVVYNPN